MKILFVRHGTSLANAGGIVGLPTVRLAEEGLEQARKTGQDLQRENVTRIVCSPFIRAQQTAEIIAGEIGIPLDQITIIEELHERRMGDLEGKPKVHETPYFYQNDSEHGFETQAELIARMQRALQKITEIAKNTDGATVAVGHATSGFYLLQVAKGKKTFSEFDPVSQMSNAEFVEVELASS
jgi:broad specificity phosphatase PhoE